MQAVAYLQSCSFDAVKPDVPKLLKWLQDLHWDVSHGVAEYLLPHVNEIKIELLFILNSDDDEWKRRVMISLIRKSPNKLDQEILTVLERIANHPTKGEIEEELDEQAREIIINRII